MTVCRYLLAALFLWSSTAAAQPAPEVIRGRVVDAENDRPLRRALVSLARSDDRARPVLTDEEGRFEIQPPDESSALTIGKAGYASTIVAPDGRAQSGELNVRLPRGGVMSGRVIERGAPAIGARVIARRVGDASRGTSYEAETDDLGEYRIGGLPAGQYTVAAIDVAPVVRFPSDFSNRQAVQGLVIRRSSLSLEVPPQTNAPGMPGPARVIEVHAGEETGDVDFETVPFEPGPSRPPEATAALLKVIEQYEGAIGGRVVTPFGQPVANALVTISGSSQLRTVVADPNGYFDGGQFKDGDYQIETGKAGYLLPDFMSHPDGATARVVHVGGDTRVHNVEIVLARGGAVVGTIVDSAGEPMQGVLVRALRLRQDGGRMEAVLATWPRLTDDRGRYRLFGLSRGSYLIVALLDATERASARSRAPGFAPVYYPGTPHIEAAQSVQIDLGSTMTGVDLTFAVSSTAGVRGTAVTARGTPLVGRVSLAVSHRSGGVAAEPRWTLVSDNGVFEFSDVPPGDYVLQAFGDPAPGTPREFGSDYVSVGDNDPPPVEITTSLGATLDGRFVADGRSSLPLRAQSIHAAPLNVDRSPPGGRGPLGLAVHDNGMFSLTGLFGSMRLTYPASSGWYLKSLTIGGLDVTDQPFDFGFGDEIFSDAEIVLSNSGATIAGSIADTPSRQAGGSSVVAFAVNRVGWFAGSRHIKRVASGPKGTFEVTDLPPGEYYVAAVDALPADWQAPHMLESLIPRAERVTAREGAASNVTLRLIRR